MVNSVPSIQYEHGYGQFEVVTNVYFTEIFCVVFQQKYGKILEIVFGGFPFVKKSGIMSSSHDLSP